RIQVDAIGSFEAGVHEYSPEGERKEFLGGTTSYRGEGASIEFVGVRIGTAITIRRPNSSAPLLKLEMIGRRDPGRAELQSDETSCGGLFLDANDCSQSHAMTSVGGTELGVSASIGFVFGA